MPMLSLVPTLRCRSQVCRGTAVMLVAPSGGLEEIENPFMQQE